MTAAADAITDTMTIAIIEDHGIARVGAEQLIDSSPGLRVIAAVATAAECAELPQPPRVVVLDLGACHPVDTASAITALAARSAVLVISRYADGRDLIAAFQAGALGLVTRNATADDFVAAVHAVARGSLYVTASVTPVVAARLRQGGRDASAGLANREAETLGLLAYGYTHGQIARRMGVTQATVNTYVKRIRGKLNAGNKAELTRMAIDLGYAIPISATTSSQD